MYVLFPQRRCLFVDLNISHRLMNAKHDRVIMIMSKLKYESKRNIAIRRFEAAPHKRSAKVGS